MRTRTAYIQLFYHPWIGRDISEDSCMEIARRTATCCATFHAEVYMSIFCGKHEQCLSTSRETTIECSGQI